MNITIPSDVVAAARVQERERITLENVAAKALIPLGRRIVIAVTRAYERGEDVTAAIRAAMEHMEPLVADAMTTAHLQGRLRSVRNATAAMAARRKAAAAYDSALAFLQRRLDLKPDEVRALRARYGNEAARVTRGLSAAVEKRAQKAVVATIESGVTLREGMANLRKAMVSAGAGPQKPYLLETLTRTQMQMAYSAGRLGANEDPAIQEILWGYTYVTAGDDRVRDEHAALDGVTLAKDDPEWNSIMPPNGFACRCSVIEVFDEGTSTGVPANVDVDGRPTVPGPDPGFAFNPGRVLTDPLPMPKVQSGVHLLPLPPKGAPPQLEALYKERQKAYGKMRKTGLNPTEQAAANRRFQAATEALQQAQRDHPEWWRRGS